MTIYKVWNPRFEDEGNAFEIECHRSRDAALRYCEANTQLLSEGVYESGLDVWVRSPDGPIEHFVVEVECIPSFHAQLVAPWRDK